MIKAEQEKGHEKGQKSELGGRGELRDEEVETPAERKDCDVSEWGG